MKTQEHFSKLVYKPTGEVEPLELENNRALEQCWF